MEECCMENVFANRLKAQQAIGCQSMENSFSANANQENEYENHPAYFDCSSCQYGSPDRYIPRRDSPDWSTRFSLIHDNKNVEVKGIKRKRGNNCGSDSLTNGGAYSNLLKNEIFGVRFGCCVQNVDSEVDSSFSNRLFQFNVSNEKTMDLDPMKPYSLSPISPSSQNLLRSIKNNTRNISRTPYKVLDAPKMRDDFYLNLVDWSSQDFLSVGLGSCVYLWSARNGKVIKLCNLSRDNDSVTSVCWNGRGNLIAVGTENGYVEIWDVCENKRLSKSKSHTARIGAVAWCNDIIASGSRDHFIVQRDIRTSKVVRKLSEHKQEVCGLKWSPNFHHLASGGNDNKLCVWDMHSTSPMQIYTEHTSAVKAIAWSPHQHGLLASGGGTADRCIRFWNTLLNRQVQFINTGSQVCNIAWSKHYQELVSTHGYGQFKITVWKYPSLNQVAKLTGHASRVLYLAMSPDGQSIVTGAGDETLRIWHNVFPPKFNSHKENKSVLNIYNIR